MFKAIADMFENLMELLVVIVIFLFLASPLILIGWFFYLLAKN